MTDLIIKARPIEWVMNYDGADGSEWSDIYYGFTILEFPAEDPGYQFQASNGENNTEHFQTLEDAKEWCQHEIDDFIRDYAVIILNYGGVK